MKKILIFLIAIFLSVSMSGQKLTTTNLRQMVDKINTKADTVDQEFTGTTEMEDLSITGSISTPTSITTDVLQVGDSANVATISSIVSTGTTFRVYEGAVQLAPDIPPSGYAELSDYAMMKPDSLTGPDQYTSDHRADLIEADLADYEVGVAASDSANGSGAAGKWVTGKDYNTDMALKDNLLTGIKFVAPTGNLITYNNTTNDAMTANRIYVAKFYLPYKLIVANIDVIVTTAATGDSINVGIYDNAGTTKLIDSGIISATGTGDKSAAVANVTLIPGFYWSAVSNTNSAIRLRGITNDGQTRLGSDAHVNGYAANPTYKGVLPSSLGAISASSNNYTVVILTNY